MRYPSERKAETHERIVETAAREFRSKGLQGIGIADLMSRLGLTHGGFYAHFRDRDALVAEAAVLAAKESLSRLMEAAEAAPHGEAVKAMLDSYLSPEHRDDCSRGCVLPALATELGRQSEPVRSAFTESLKSNLATIAARMPADDDATRLAQAMTLISGMAGGMLIARAMSDPELSKLLLDSVRDQLSGLYESWRNGSTC